MKKFQVIYQSPEGKKVFKVKAKNKKDAVRIFRKCRDCSFIIVDVVEVYDRELQETIRLRIVFGCIAAFIILLFIAVATSSCRTLEPVDFDSYVVQPGDTLWEIAMKSDGWNKMDAYYIISAIKDHSDCTALIYPGQIVYIPCYGR